MYILPFGLVRSRTFHLVHGLVRCTHWVQVFRRPWGGCDNQRCHNKTPRLEMKPWTWIMSCPEALRILEFEKRTVSWDSSLEEGSRFLVSPRRDLLESTKCAAHGGVRWKSQHSKKVCVSLSLLVSKNLKLKKVIKSFVPEPMSSVFGFPTGKYTWPSRNTSA